MSELFQLHLTAKDIIKYKLNLKRHTLINIPYPSCHMWKGRIHTNGYGTLRVTIRGSRYRVTAHRLMYYLFNCSPLDPDMHVSHLCHHKLCINLSHLSLEPGRINNKRRKCVTKHICQGHAGYARCIL
jgi:hypothetical protein